MTFKEKVHQLLDQAFEENPELFMLECHISESNSIRVVIDGDRPVAVTDCMTISRAVEHSLDREEEDFAIEVTTAGVTSPLVHERQYIKNIGRTLEVTREGEKDIKAELTAVTDGKAHFKWKSREPKPVGKGKHTVLKEAAIPLEEIKQAKVILKF